VLRGRREHYGHVGVLQFVASLIGSLAWPCTILVLVLTIWFSAPKENRNDLLRRLRKAGPNGLELDEAEREIEAATGPPISGGNSDLTDDLSDDLPYDDAMRRKMEALIEAAARWGWVRAGREAAEAPMPLVAWSARGATIVRRSGQVGVNPGDTLTFAVGSFTDANTGRPNTATYTRTNYGQPPIDLEEPEPDHG